LAAVPQGHDRRPLQIHYVYCLRAIPDGWTAGQKERLLAWFDRSQAWRGGASFQGYINRLFDSALEFFSEPERTAAYERFPDYAPLDEETAKKLTQASGFQSARVFARRGWGSGLTEQEILEYLLYDPMTLRADPERGRTAYEKALCASCHRFGDMGLDYGPDLTTIASRFKRRDIIEATLWPSRTISDQYAAVEITTRDGTTYLGTVAAEDDRHVHLQIVGVTRPVAIAKDSIASRKRSETSTMPGGLLDELSLQEIADLFAFLETGTTAARD
jgi:putative heme-binding domain-containing protein